MTSLRHESEKSWAEYRRTDCVYHLEETQTQSDLATGGGETADGSVSPKHSDQKYVAVVCLERNLIIIIYM